MSGPNKRDDATPNQPSVTVRCQANVHPDSTERCQWTGTRDELGGHAAESGHPVCVVCETRSLRPDETQTCHRCVERVRDTLTAIVAAYKLLPDTAYASGYRNQAMPGGDALVLLAAGSTQGGGPDDDDKFHDPIPVAAELDSWQRDWLEELPLNRTNLGAATVAGYVGWFTTWLATASSKHRGFDDFASEMRELLGRVQRTVALSGRVRRAEAPCRACGGVLRYVYADKVADDHFTCRDCRVDVAIEDYYWGLRVDAADADGWVQVGVAAAYISRPQAMIRRWADEGFVESKRDERGRMLVRLADCRERVSGRRECA